MCNKKKLLSGWTIVSEMQSNAIGYTIWLKEQMYYEFAILFHLLIN